MSKEAVTSCVDCKNAVYEGPLVPVAGIMIPAKRRDASKCKSCIYEHLQIQASKNVATARAAKAA